MTKLTQNILDKIKKEDLRPKPKWYFILMHTLLWLSVVLTIFLGSLAVAITLRHLFSAPWEFVQMVVPNPVHAFGLMLPYVWLIFIGLTIFLAMELFKHTKQGYRFRPLYVVLGSISLSFILGIGLYFARADQPIEAQLRQHLGPYAQWHEKRQKILVAPEKGLLAGVIVELEPKDNLILLDFGRETWEVQFKNARAPELFVGMPVGVMGKVIADHQFNARVIRPLPGPNLVVMPIR